MAETVQRVQEINGVAVITVYQDNGAKLRTYRTGVNDARCLLGKDYDYFRHRSVAIHGIDKSRKLTAAEIKDLLHQTQLTPLNLEGT